MINTHSHTHTQILNPRTDNGMIFTARKFPAAAGFRKVVCAENNIKCKKIQGANETPLYCY